MASAPGYYMDALAAAEYDALALRHSELMARVPSGPTSVEVEGVIVYVAPDVMFIKQVHKPAWHKDEDRAQRKDMIKRMCVGRAARAVVGRRLG